VSLKSSLWRYLGLLAVAALAVGVFAGPASAKKMSAKQRAAVRTQLRKQLKKNPAVISRKSFIKRASLVNFVLPVTIRLRDGDKPGTPNKESATANPNYANIDLGASLGKREVDLGGSLSAEIIFHDSFDGGALGNVDLNILPSANHHLTSTSIPLLWNTQVTQPGSRYDSNSLGLPDGLAGCGASGAMPGGFTGNTALPFGADNTTPVIPIFGAAGLPGFPYFANVTDAVTWSSTHAPALVAGYLPEKPGIDGTDRISASKEPGNNDAVGGNPDPFPYTAQSDPTADGVAGQPTAADTVLRTSALDLNIAPVGTEVDQATANQNHPQGSQNLVMGKSGGQANLFGNIPGKSYGVDVTVNLQTRINSILRIVDQDSTGAPLLSGGYYPAGIFNCRQVYTGAVQNYIPAVHIKGSLKIAPAITHDGKLRIAKTILTQLGSEPSRFAVTACLQPHASYTLPQNSSDTSGPGTQVPGPNGGAPVADSALPGDTTQKRATPSTVDCNSAPTGLVADSALNPFKVTAQAPAVPADGYTTTNDGSKVSVAADLTVGTVIADVLIGDAP
jgi:hypothetical protein